MNRCPGGVARLAGSGVASSFVLATAATIAVLLISAPSAANAWPTPGDSVALPLRVELRNWSCINANGVIPWWDDYIKVIDTSGRTRYVSRFKIESIRDAHDRELTNQVLLGRRSFGEEPAKPPTPPPPRVSESYRVTVAGEDTLAAALVSSWPGDYVRIIDGGGSIRYVPAYRVVTVVDSSGADVTSRVLKQGKSLGTAPPEVRPWRPPAVPKSPLSGAIVHGGVLFRADDYDPSRSGSVLLQVDLGGMTRLSDRYGIGATMFYSGDDEVMNFGVKARVRRLLRRSFVLDLAPGATLGTATDGSIQSSTPAFICEADITFKRWLSFTSQVEATRRRYAHYSYSIGSWEGPGQISSWEDKTDWAWYLGFKIGGPGGVPAAFLTSLAIAAAHSIQSLGNY
jgi:hypothetical protein